MGQVMGWAGIAFIVACMVYIIVAMILVVSDDPKSSLTSTAAFVGTVCLIFLFVIGLFAIKHFMLFGTVTAW